MMCDELDIAFDKTSLIMGRTDTTPNQGGSGGSTAIERDGWPMRRVAAEARRVLLELAGKHFGVPVAQLEVKDATIILRSGPTKSITYAELIGGKRFNIALTGKNIDATTGLAEVKPVDQLRVVGHSPQRYDIPAKVDGSLTWAVDVKLPGMVHARNVRPPVAGAVLRSIDETSVKNIPGFVRVISRGNYVAVLCEREEQAIRAARELKINWQPPATAPFPHRTSFSTICAAPRPHRAASRRFWAIRPERWRPPIWSSRPNTKSRSKVIPPSARRTLWLTRPMAR